MEYASRSMRTGKVLECQTHWLELLRGEIHALVLEEFASPAECSQLLEFVTDHPRLQRYETAPGIWRLGNSFSDVRKSGSLRESYNQPDILTESLQVCPAILRMIGIVAASWPMGIETLKFGSTVLQRSVARRVTGSGAEPHDDDIAKDLPGDPVASSVTVQLGINLYLEVPAYGGELEGWDRRLSADEYATLRVPGSYGVHREVIGDPDWVIKPSTGDLVIFCNSSVHAIRSAPEPRTTWGMFLGYRGNEQPFLVWS